MGDAGERGGRWDRGGRESQWSDAEGPYSTVVSAPSPFQLHRRLIFRLYLLLHNYSWWRSEMERIGLNWEHSADLKTENLVFCAGNIVKQVDPGPVGKYGLTPAYLGLGPSSRNAMLTRRSSRSLTGATWLFT